MRSCVISYITFDIELVFMATRGLSKINRSITSINRSRYVHSTRAEENSFPNNRSSIVWQCAQYADRRCVKSHECRFVKWQSLLLRTTLIPRFFRPLFLRSYQQKIRVVQFIIHNSTRSVSSCIPKFEIEFRSV